MKGQLVVDLRKVNFVFQNIQIKYNTADSDDDVTDSAEGHSEVITDEEELGDNSRMPRILR